METEFTQTQGQHRNSNWFCNKCTDKYCAYVVWYSYTLQPRIPFLVLSFVFLSIPLEMYRSCHYDSCCYKQWLSNHILYLSLCLDLVTLFWDMDSKPRSWTHRSSSTLNFTRATGNTQLWALALLLTVSHFSIQFLHIFSSFWIFSFLKGINFYFLLFDVSKIFKDIQNFLL
jgi:hypothetical protein